MSASAVVRCHVRSLVLCLLALAGAASTRAAGGGEAAPPPLPRQAWEAAKRSHSGPGPVLWIGMPTERDRVTGAERLRYAGCTEPGATVRLDGQPLTVYPTGAFAGVLALRPGQNAFVFRAEFRGEATERRIVVERTVAPERVLPRRLGIASGWPIEPQPGALGLAPGERLAIDFHGTPGSRGWFRIGASARRHFMREVPGERGHYRAEYAIEPDDDFDDAPIRIGLDARAPGSASRSTVSMPTGATLTVGGNRVHRLVAALAGDTPIFAAESRNATRLAHVARGTRLEATGRRGDFLRVRLGAEGWAWVTASEFGLAPAGEKPPNAAPPLALPPESALTAVGTPTARWDEAARETVVRFPLHAPREPAAPLPFRLTGGNGTEPARLTLWGARPEAPEAPAWNVPDNPMVRTLSAARADTLTLTLTADTGPLWGSNVLFAADAMEWRLRAWPAAPRRNARQPLQGLAVLVDAGHGGEDSGALGAAGLYESDANLAIARRLKRLLETEGARVTLTRNPDTYVSLDDRVSQIARERPDLFVSIHNNSVGASDAPLAARGAQTYYAADWQQPLARSIEDAVRTATGIAPGNGLVAQAAHRVTRNCPWAPAVLVECAFVSQPEDEAQLLSPAFLDSLAQGIYKGIAAFARGPAVLATEPAATRH